MKIIRLGISLFLILSSFQAAYSLKIRPATAEEREQGIVAAVFPTIGEMKKCARANKNGNLMRYNYVLSDSSGLGFGQSWNSSFNEPVAFIHPTDGLTPFYLSPQGDSGRFLIQLDCSANDQATFFKPVKTKRISINSNGELAAANFNAASSANAPRVNFSKDIFITRSKGSNPEFQIIDQGFNISGVLTKSNVAKLKIPSGIDVFNIKNNASENIDIKLVLKKGKITETFEVTLAQGLAEEIDFENTGNIRISIESIAGGNTNYDFDITFPSL